MHCPLVVFFLLGSASAIPASIRPSLASSTSTHSASPQPTSSSFIIHQPSPQRPQIHAALSSGDSRIPSPYSSSQSGSPLSGTANSSASSLGSYGSSRADFAPHHPITNDYLHAAYDPWPFLLPDRPSTPVLEHNPDQHVPTKLELHPLTPGLTAFRMKIDPWHKWNPKRVQEFKEQMASKCALDWESYRPGVPLPDEQPGIEIKLGILMEGGLESMACIKDRVKVIVGEEIICSFNCPLLPAQ